VNIREALRTAAERLETHRISNARLTAELLLAHSLSVDREYLYAHDDRVLRDHEYQSLEDALYDRVSGVPLQYIVGRQEFYGRYFRVNPAVLIPRPETEHIVESVIEICEARDAPRIPAGIRGASLASRTSPFFPRIIDVGTGSGCIAVTLALEIPGSEVFASDISEAAVRVAKENATALGAPVAFACMDILDAVTGLFDVITSNPPYVRPDDLSRLQREVRDHEPHVALFSSEDGLVIYRRLIQAGHERLRPGGHLVMEIGIGMEEKVLELFGAGWEKLPTKADLQGIPRTVIARSRPR
jgi:release factor glutamine methyltransferase